MDTPTPPPIVQPPPSSDQRLRVHLVIRDAILISVLTFIGGMVIGLTIHPVDSPRGMLAIAASNLLLGTIGFTVSGSFAVANRWRHLAYVAFGV